MEGASRTRLVALAVLLAVSVPLVVLALAGGGSDDDDAPGLRVERAKGGVPEVIIYLEDPAVNEPDTNRGKPQVRIHCLDAAGEVIFRGAERWPFSDTDGGVFDPHVHVSIEPAVLDNVRRCRLDTDPPLEGRKV